MTNLKCVLAAISLLVMSSGLLAKSLPQTKAERVGMSSERLDRITAMTQKYVDEGKLAGVITMVARDGKLVHFEAVGNKGVDDARPLEKDDLFRIRKELEADVEEYSKHTENPEFKAIWGDNKGECVKTAPKGFFKDHPNIEWIRYKQHLFTHSFTDKEVLQEDFADTVNDCFQVMRPFFDYMSNVLTTDLNGESLI